MKLKRIIICVFFYLNAHSGKAQDPFFTKDSTLFKLFLPDTTVIGDTIRKDSLKLYKDIHAFAVQRKITFWIYKLIFNEHNLYPVKISSYNPSSPAGPSDNFDTYAGRIIRHVKIISLDPFGSSVQDTSLKRDNFLKNVGNRFHITSNNITIKNRMLFKKDKPLDPLLLRESERLIRSAGFIRDAKILVDPIKGNEDSVDVTVLSQDRWSIVVGAVVSGGSTRFILTEKNFLGWGHYSRNNLVVDYKDPFNPKIDGTYSTSYIRNSFVSVTGRYNNSLTNSIVGLSVDRPFYSPIAKWAGGIGYLNYNTTALYSLDSINSSSFSLEYDQKDAWAGRSFQLVKGRSVSKRTTRFIMSGSFLDIHYLRRPSFDYDKLMNNQHRKQYLGAIGLTNQQYYKDSYIYRFGEAEDVPTGRLFEIIGGLEQKEFSHRYYAAGKVSAGNHINNLGNVAFTTEYATYFLNGKREEGVLNLGFDYFTNRWKIGKWSGRQFAYSRFIKGYNRRPSDKININDNNGIYGFKSEALIGDRKAFLNLISVVYTPVKFLGFHFAAMIFGSFGTVANSREEFMKSRIYQGYGIGILIRNDQLLVKSFEVSIGIYPFKPEDSHSSFRMDVISPSDIRFRDYGMSRPGTISYE